MKTVQNGKGSAERSRIDYKKRRENHDAIQWPSQKPKTETVTVGHVMDLGGGRKRILYRST